MGRGTIEVTWKHCLCKPALQADVSATNLAVLGDVSLQQGYPAGLQEQIVPEGKHAYH